MTASFPLYGGYTEEAPVSEGCMPASAPPAIGAGVDVARHHFSHTQGKFERVPQLWRGYTE